MITSTKRELTNAIRLGIRPCGFCLLKRTKHCEIDPPVLHRNIETSRFAKVPNLKRVYSTSCPSEEIKNNLIKLIDCYFNFESIQDNSLSSLLDHDKSEYKKVVVEHIRPCSTCSNKNDVLCNHCTSEDVKIDLLQIIDEVYDLCAKKDM